MTSHSKVKQLQVICGMDKAQNTTSNGRALGYRNCQLQAVAIPPDQQDDGLAIQVHLMIGKGHENTLRVCALTLPEAQEWQAQLQAAIQQYNEAVKTSNRSKNSLIEPAFKRLKS